MNHIRRRFASIAAIAMAAAPLLITIYLLFWSPGDLSASRTGNQRVFGATYVIGYDHLLENTTGVDGIVQFGSVKTGELLAQALLDGLKEMKGEGPWNIELFGGGPADPNAPNFFQGAMSVLQPLIDDGTLTVVSGQMDFTQCATMDWDNAVRRCLLNKIK